MTKKPLTLARIMRAVKKDVVRKCSLCGGSLMTLGVLGSLTWLRCRACGMMFSRG